MTTADMTDAYRLYAPDECTGRDGYPPVWHERLKHEVREAAGHRCIRCGHPFKCGESNARWSPCDERCNHDGPFRWLSSRGWLPLQADEGALARELIYEHGAHVEAAYRVLTVHHLDGNKGNCRWWNLVALCQRCHLTIQGRVQMARVWPWRHSEWFRPYVAGYYAHVYLAEDLSRDEVEARLGELLALERVA